MANPKMKGVVALWGVGNIYSSEIVTDISRDDDGEIDFLLDNNGFKNGAIFYDDNTPVQVDLICSATTVRPSRGDALAISNAMGTITGTLMVMKTTVKWTQKGWQKLTISATAYVNLTATSGQ